MVPTRPALILALSAGLCGCATMTPAQLDRTQKASREGFEQAAEAGILATQQANQAALMNATMFQMSTYSLPAAAPALSP